MALGIAVQDACLRRVHPQYRHTELCKHDGVVRPAQRHRSVGVAGLSSSLEYDSGRDHIARRNELLALFHENLDLLRIKHTGSFARRRNLSARLTRLHYRHGLALGCSPWL